MSLSSEIREKLKAAAHEVLQIVEHPNAELVHVVEAIARHAGAPPELIKILGPLWEAIGASSQPAAPPEPWSSIVHEDLLDDVPAPAPPPAPIASIAPAIAPAAAAAAAELRCGWCGALVGVASQPCGNCGQIPNTRTP